MAATAAPHAGHDRIRTADGHPHVTHAASDCGQHADHAAGGDCQCDGACLTAAGIAATPFYWSAPPATVHVAGLHPPSGLSPVLGVPTPPPEVC
jgi:hypothetical protein